MFFICSIVMNIICPFRTWPYSCIWLCNINTIDINTRLAKVWAAIDRVSVTWKSDLKRIFSKQRSCPFYYMEAPFGRWLSVPKKSWTEIAQGCYELYQTNLGSNIPQNSSCTATNHLSRRPSKLDEQGDAGTLLEEQGRTHKRRSPMDPFTWTYKYRTTI